MGFWLILILPIRLSMVVRTSSGIAFTITFYDMSKPKIITAITNKIVNNVANRFTIKWCIANSL